MAREESERLSVKAPGCSSEPGEACLCPVAEMGTDGAVSQPRRVSRGQLFSLSVYFFRNSDAKVKTCVS